MAKATQPVLSIHLPGNMHGRFLEGKIVKKAEIQRLARYLGDYQDRFDPLFPRTQMRHWAREYVGGLLMDMERKNCWQIAEAQKTPAENLKSLQHFLYGSPWPWRPIIDEMGHGSISRCLG